MSISAQERQEVLQLLAEGKITVEEAAALLSGAKEPEATAEKEAAPAALDETIKLEPEDAPEKSAGGPGWLHVRVSDMKTGKNKVLVNVPMRLVRYGLAIGRRYAPELEELDWNQISGFLSTEKGMLVEVEDEEDGEHVQIYVD